MARPKKVAPEAVDGETREYVICGLKSEIKVKDDDGNVLGVKVFGETIQLTPLRAAQIGAQVVCTPTEWNARVKNQKPVKAVAVE